MLPILLLLLAHHYECKEFSVGILVSGLQERMLPEAISSLSKHVIQPQIREGFRVVVFVVLQQGNGNKLPPSKFSVSNYTEVNLKRIFEQEVARLGFTLFCFHVQPKPMIHDFSKHLNLTNIFRNFRFQWERNTWLSNLYMFDNLRKGFLIVQKFAGLHLPSRQFDVLVRTRTDNVFWITHRPYNSYPPGGIVVPSCKGHGGIYDRFLLLMSKAANDAFFLVIDEFVNRSLANIRYLSSEVLWQHKMRRLHVPINKALASEFQVCNVALTKTFAICFREFESCVAQPQIDYVKSRACPGV